MGKRLLLSREDVRILFKKVAAPTLKGTNFFKKNIWKPFTGAAQLPMRRKKQIEDWSGGGGMKDDVRRLM